jgi:hypothetical protein
MFDRFTEGARKAICLARNEARALRHALVGTEHLLLGLARERSGGAAVVLDRLDLDRESVRNEVRRLVPGGAPIPEGVLLSLTARGVEALAAAEKAARRSWRPGDPRTYIGTEHILVGLLSIPGCGASRVLDRLGRRDLACREVLRLLFAGKSPPKWSEWTAAPGTGPPGGDELAWLDAGKHLGKLTSSFLTQGLKPPLLAAPGPLPALPAAPTGSLCPRGHGAMDQLLRQGVHVAVCPRCLGTFFPPGELEKALRVLGATLAGPGAADELAKLLWRLLDPSE